MPSEAQSDGEYFSTTISTSWVREAMTAMNTISERKLRSTSANSGPAHTRAPGPSTQVVMRQFAGTVMASMKVTATPSPKAVATFLLTAMNEHMPRKQANIMLSIKIDRMNRFRFSMALFFLKVFVETALNPDDACHHHKSHGGENHQAVIHISGIV